jgi:transposase, IS30 family
MRKRRKEFTLEERQLLHVMLCRGAGFDEIAVLLDRNPKVVKRAALRYKPASPVVLRAQAPLERAWHDHEEHRRRLRKPKHRLRLRTRERQDYVEKRLEKASPELIAGRYRLEHPGDTMSHESIYQWIYADRRDLIQRLEIVSKRGNRPRSSSRQYRHREPAPPKRSISVRPKAIEKRKRVGHFERDTVHGPKGSGACVLNLAERRSRTVFLRKLHAIQAEPVKQATKERLQKLPPALRLTMTQDNGPENSLHHEEEREMGMTHFFCHPYSAYERGTVEKLNRSAIRRFFPKGTDFSLVNFSQIEQAEAAHNNRPMKCLAYRTPLEVFAKALMKYNLAPADVGLRQLPW